MKKLPLNYKNQVVGYVDEIIYDDNGEVKDAYIYLYQNEYIDEIINNINRGLVATLNKNPDIDNLENNTLYQIELKDDLLILRKLKA